MIPEKWQKLLDFQNLFANLEFILKKEKDIAKKDAKINRLYLDGYVEILIERNIEVFTSRILETVFSKASN